MEFKFDCIIPLGQTCNITFLLENCRLKSHTSLFEWFVSNRLNDITNVLIKIVDNSDSDIIKQDGPNVYIGDAIFSGHYKADEFKSIYERRRQRLLDLIKTNKRILFIRFEADCYLYTNNDIGKFIQTVQSINPDIGEMKLLFISPNKINSEHPFLLHEFYDKHSQDPYCRGVEINSLFINALKKYGYNTDNMSDLKFTDKSLN